MRAGVTSSPPWMWKGEPSIHAHRSSSAASASAPAPKCRKHSKYSEYSKYSKCSKYRKHSRHSKYRVRAGTCGPRPLLHARLRSALALLEGRALVALGQLGHPFRRVLLQEDERGVARSRGLRAVVAAGERRLAPLAALAAPLDDERGDVVAVVIAGRGLELQVARLECRLWSERGHLLLSRMGWAPSQPRLGLGLGFRVSVKSGYAGASRLGLRRCF
jgi:hypothetical protein